MTRARGTPRPGAPRQHRRRNALPEGPAQRGAQVLGQGQRLERLEGDAIARERERRRHRARPRARSASGRRAGRAPRRRRGPEACAPGERSATASASRRMASRSAGGASTSTSAPKPRSQRRTSSVSATDSRSSSRPAGELAQLLARVPEPPADMRRHGAGEHGAHGDQVSAHDAPRPAQVGLGVEVGGHRERVAQTRRRPGCARRRRSGPRGGDGSAPRGTGRH